MSPIRKCKSPQDSRPGNSARKQRPPTSQSPFHLTPRYGAALRANPFPEVTDQVCRLPLPTLFYRLEAFHLGDLLRILVRSGTRFTCLPRLFKGRVERTRHHIDRGALRKQRRESVPKPEKRALARALLSVAEFVCVTALDNHCWLCISVSRYMNINMFPFR